MVFSWVRFQPRRNEMKAPIAPSQSSPSIFPCFQNITSSALQTPCPISHIIYKSYNLHHQYIIIIIIRTKPTTANVPTILRIHLSPHQPRPKPRHHLNNAAPNHLSPRRPPPSNKHHRTPPRERRHGPPHNLQQTSLVSLPLPKPIHPFITPPLLIRPPELGLAKLRKKRRYRDRLRRKSSTARFRNRAESQTPSPYQRRHMCIRHADMLSDRRHDVRSVEVFWCGWK